ncbi:MAG: protein kinase domain-containing protein [Nannocystales bacterium]
MLFEIFCDLEAAEPGFIEVDNSANKERGGVVTTTDDAGFLEAPMHEDDSLLGERGQVAAALFGGAVRPQTIGRYRVTDTLGHGAMGVVYEAWDDELQRTVAVKLISRDAEVGQAEHRFRREALALAKLAHPNVVTVHEVGLLDGRLFIAMEMVRGETLDAWLRAEERTWEATLDVFIQAGRGLEAAHEAGLVHRDFKPSNCIVGESGRVRVLDFGLARGAADLLDEDVAATFPAVSSLDVSVTRTGATVGTPAYMAPEQLRGGDVSASSDQFSFCVALYEALEGVRPFAGKCIVDIHGNIEAGNVQRGTGRTPRAVLRIVGRGFAVSPSDRWPDLAALVDALQEIPNARGRRRRAWWMTGVGALALATAGTALLPEQPCAEPPTTRIWSPPRRSTLETAMEGSTAWETLDAAVSRWGRDWSEAHASTCKAARVDGRTTEMVLARQRACLERRENTVDVLLDGLAGTDAPRHHAADVVRRLPSLDDCRSAEAVLGQGEPPPASQPDVATVQSLLDESVASLTVGDIDRADALVETAERLATKVGHAPLLADIGLRRAEIGRQRDADGGGQSLRDAFKLAESSACDTAAADAALLLVFLSLDRDDLQAARRWRDVAEAKLERTGAGAKRRTQLAHANAELALVVGDFDAAEAASKEALRDCAEAAGEDSLLCADALEARARVVEWTGSPDESEVEHGRALQAFRRLLGESHPSVGTALLNRGLFRMGVGHLDAASADFDAALPILETGRLPRVQAQLLLARAQLDSMRGQLELSALQRVETLLDAYPVGDSQRTDYESALAAFYLRLKQPEKALEIYERVLAAHESTSERIPGLVALDHSNLGECLLELDRLREARVRFSSALKRLEGEVSTTDPRLSYPLTGLGRVLVAQGHHDRAAELLERSLAIATEHPGDVVLLAQTQWALARALGVESKRGQSLARASRDGFLAASDDDSAQRVLNSLREQNEP